MSRIITWWRSWEITIDSNWITTIAMALAAAACSALLLREASHLVFGNFGVRSLYGPNRFSSVLNVGAALYLIVLAFVSRPWFLRVGFGLVAIAFAGHLFLDYFHAPPSLQYQAAILGSVVRQIAYVIFLVAVVQWFKSVTRWVPRSDSGVDNP